jgi:hypothetical protein
VAHSPPLVRLTWTLRAPLGIVSASRPLPAWGHANGRSANRSP